MKISIIAALSENWIIGNKRQIPWHISEDLKRFKKLTSNHHVIMGRVTFESIGKILPNRTTIVMSTDKKFNIKGCLVSHSLNETIKLIESLDEEVFVAGGNKIYKLFLPFADKLYLTRVRKKFRGDTYFPKFSESKFKLISSKKNKQNGLEFDYEIYAKKNP